MGQDKIGVLDDGQQIRVAGRKGSLDHADQIGIVRQRFSRQFLNGQPETLQDLVLTRANGEKGEPFALGHIAAKVCRRQNWRVAAHFERFAQGDERMDIAMGTEGRKNDFLGHGQKVFSHRRWEAKRRSGASPSTPGASAFSDCANALSALCKCRATEIRVALKDT
jgi:hypothetical protein